MIPVPIVFFSSSLEFLEYGGPASLVLFLLIMGITAFVTRKDRHT